MKELNIIEAMKMPIGTEFEIVLDGKKHDSAVMILQSFDKKSKKILVWDGEKDYQVFVTDSTLRAKFIPIQQPVSFMEAIKASQEGKIIHSTIDGKEYTYHPRNNKFTELTARETRGGLSAYEILEGKWYIEE